MLVWGVSFLAGFYFATKLLSYFYGVALTRDWVVVLAAGWFLRVHQSYIAGLHYYIITHTHMIVAVLTVVWPG